MVDPLSQPKKISLAAALQSRFWSVSSGIFKMPTSRPSPRRYRFYGSVRFGGAANLSEVKAGLGCN